MAFLKPVLPLIIILGMLNCSSSSTSSAKVTGIKKHEQANFLAPNKLPVPIPKIYNKTNQELNLSGGITTKNISSLNVKYPVVINSILETVDKYKTKKKPILLKVLAGDSLQNLGLQLPANFSSKKEGYVLKILPNQITLIGNDTLGILNGFSTLETLIKKGKGKINSGVIIDWPDHSIRALHFSIKKITPNIIKGMIDRARTGHFNTVLLYIKSSVKLKSLGPLTKVYAIEASEFVEVVKYARESGMKVIPTLDLLTHQNKGFLNKNVYPELMYNDKTYDPRKKEVYTHVFALIDELDSLIHPEVIHIGHDEVVGHTAAQATENGPILPAPLFLYDVKKISSYLQQKNIKTWMWGDMFLQTSSFPGMHPGSLNATQEYANLIDSIPKHIVIGDWHYKHYKGRLKGKLRFPTIDYFEDHGFNVLGATWNVPEITKSFSTYCIKPRHKKTRGMIATTWSLLLKEASRKNSNEAWPEVDAILETSSEAFWNAKPITD